MRTLEQSEFHVADAPALLAGDPTVALYVAAILARRLDAANRSLIEVKRQLQAGESLSVIGKTVEKVEETVKGYSEIQLDGDPAPVRRRQSRVRTAIPRTRSRS